MMRRSSLPGSGGVSGKRSSSRSTTVKTPQITIGEDSPSASKDRQRYIKLTDCGTVRANQSNMYID